VLAPAQSSGAQHLVEARALHRDPLLFDQVRDESVERPGREGQCERLRLRQRGRNDLRDLLRRVGRPPTTARAILETGESARIEALHPAAHRLGVDPAGDGNRLDAVAVVRRSDDARPLDRSSRCRAGVGQALQCQRLIRGQCPQLDGLHRDLTGRACRAPHHACRRTWRMHH
jgi:hypothetical protein